MKNLFSFTAIIIFIITCLPSTARQQDWINTAGRSFTARLKAMDDRNATFVMKDGTVNIIAVTALDLESQAIARRLWNLPEIPDVLKATYNINLRYLRRVRQLHEENLLDDIEYADAKRRLLNGFRYMYRKHRLPENEYAAIEQRLLNAAANDL